LDGNILDDPARLKAERESADRSYNEALTKVDHAIQRQPADFPQPPPGPDEHQVAALNTLWKITPPSAQGAVRRAFAAAVRRVVGPMFEQQQAFNSAVVDHINRNVPVARQTSESIDRTLAILRAHVEELIRFQSLLVMFLQQITPYVDTRDRDVAGLLRGLSGAINAVADELMKRSEALLARDARREAQIDADEQQIAAVEQQIAALRGRLEHLIRTLPGLRDQV
jgi:hypothetical protein